MKHLKEELNMSINIFENFSKYKAGQLEDIW